MQLQSTATHLKILVDRDDEWDLRMEMVKGARKFVVLTTYYFAVDARVRALADALVAAARRGVRVIIVYDGFGQGLAQGLTTQQERRTLRQTLHAIEGAGGLVVAYRPADVRHRLIGGGMHIKIQVSEAGVALFGSSNIGHHSFHQWNEVSVEMQGPIVAALLAQACQLAALSSAESEELAALLPATSQGSFALRYLSEDPAKRSTWSFPLGSVDNRLTNELVSFIDTATQTLRITSLYCKPTSALMDAILRACRRGVDVEIFHSHRDSLGVTHLPWISASMQYGALLQAGAHIYENRGGEHSKILLIDDRAVSVGSYNLEHAAHDRLIEAMIFIDHPAVCARFASLFTALRRCPDNAKLPASWLGELPATLRVKRWLLRPLQRWV